MYNEIRKDVKAHITNAIGDEYFKELPKTFVESVVRDVVLTSSFEDDGSYNDSDIRFAFGRMLLEKCGVLI
jgi:hypothetical protein